MSGRLHLSRRFLSSLLPGGPSAEARSWVGEQLSDAELALWKQMYGPDRRHSVAVAREIERLIGRGVTKPVLAAALLHDVGKIEAGLGTWGRVVATAAAKLSGPATAAAKLSGPATAKSWIDSSGFTRKVGLYLNHAKIGADLLRRAGSDPLTVSWAGEHHRPAEEWTIDPAIAQILHDVDDD